MDPSFDTRLAQIRTWQRATAVILLLGAAGSLALWVPVHQHLLLLRPWGLIVYGPVAAVSLLVWTWPARGVDRVAQRHSLGWWASLGTPVLALLATGVAAGTTAWIFSLRAWA